jgi:hypothetical protein
LQLVRSLQVHWYVYGVVTCPAATGRRYPPALSVDRHHCISLFSIHLNSHTISRHSSNLLVYVSPFTPVLTHVELTQSLSRATSRRKHAQVQSLKNYQKKIRMSNLWK